MHGQPDGWKGNGLKAHSVTIKGVIRFPNAGYCDIIFICSMFGSGSCCLVKSAHLTKQAGEITHTKTYDFIWALKRHSSNLQHQLLVYQLPCIIHSNICMLTCSADQFVPVHFPLSVDKAKAYGSFVFYLVLRGQTNVSWSSADRECSYMAQSVETDYHCHDAITAKETTKLYPLIDNSINQSGILPVLRLSRNSNRDINTI